MIQLREDTDIPAGRLEGKVEHIASYRAARFHSVEELLTFLTRVLAELKGGDPPGSSVQGKEQP